MRGCGESLETPVVCADVKSLTENPPCDYDRARRRCVHRIQPRVRDDRDTPLVPGWTGEVIAVIWVAAEAVYLSGRGWTGSIRLIWFDNLG
ncbi:MAG TPA: hypothetical protein VHN11_22605 [Xanthobacteraceae bacterium]|nr:hypothetical protein [Xanthobacteraceae bacterium]